MPPALLDPRPDVGLGNTVTLTMELTKSNAFLVYSWGNFSEKVDTENSITEMNFELRERLIFLSQETQVAFLPPSLFVLSGSL